MFDDLGHAKVDLNRDDQKGYPEIIYGKSKTSEQILDIIESLLAHDRPILATRVNEEKWTDLKDHLPDHTHYDESSQVLTIGSCPQLEKGKICILSAGTSDYPVAQEAKLTAQWMGCTIQDIHDVGVAGIHRLLAYEEELRQANVVIVVAGMEGALPSVVSGLIQAPVLAVPTSVGYGANLEGLTTMLAMLTSCSSGISVVNINNGFGAAYQAALILRQLNQ